MAIPKIEGAQRDFSYGEIDIGLKRSDEHPARKAGLRQMANARILNSNVIQNRPGRSALFPITAGLLRTEEFNVKGSVGGIFKIGFGPGVLQIINSAGTVVAGFLNKGSGAALPWVSQADIESIVYCVIGLSVYICFGHSMRPQVVTFDGVSQWSIADYTELVIGGQKRTPFFRISPQGLQILPNLPTGSVTIDASNNLFVPGMVGTRIRYLQRQILITGVTNSTTASGTVEETLPGSQVIEFTSNPATAFSIGDVVIGSVSGAQGQVVNIGSLAITVQLLTNSTSTTFAEAGALTFAFTSSDTVVGPAGGLAASVVDVVSNPQEVADWDDEVMNDFRGYPASCFTDQFRLGFCDFPSVPNGIAWSAINSSTDLYVGAISNNAMFELTPDSVRVYYVVPGAESSEFVFCDRKLYYIPINATTPLEPGNVAFNILSSDGCGRVQPRPAQEVIVYANAGLNSLMAVIAPGNYYRPFNTVNVSEFATHLFDGIAAIAMPTADGTFPERYAYVLNGNGKLVVGKYTVKDGQFSGGFGWGPWSGGGTVDWVAAWDADVIFTSSYFGVPICEILDDTQLLDAALPVNNLPAAFAAPPGKGPLWWIPNQSVTLIDQGTRFMGTYQIDGDGNIVPQFNDGENLEIASLVAGQPWTMITEPFAADANPGTSVGQRLKRRRISRFMAYVENSTGFEMARLFSGPITPWTIAKGIVLGTVMNRRVFPMWNTGEIQTAPPPLREGVEQIRPLGHFYDPRVAIIKSTPGTLLIAELGMEVSV